MEITPILSVGSKVQNCFYPDKKGTVVAFRLFQERRRDKAEIYSVEYDVMWKDGNETYLDSSLFYGVTICQAE